MTTPLGAVFNQLATGLSQFIDKEFPDKCSISRPTSTTGDYGTAAPSYSTVASNVGCIWAPAGKNAMKYLRSLKVTASAGYEITLPGLVSGVAIDVKPKDRIVVAARGQEPQRTFEIQGPPLRNAGVTVEVLCILVES